MKAKRKDRLSQIKEIASSIKALENDLSLCTRCGMCQSVCPLYSETGREPDSARGKLALLDGLRFSLLSNPDGVMDLLQRCLLCGACASHCPRKVNSISVFLRARMIISGITGLNPFKKAILRAACNNPVIFDMILDAAGFFQKKLSADIAGTSDFSCIRDGFRSKQRISRNFAPKSFSEITGTVDYRRPGSKGRVAFYPGCLVNRMYPFVGTASLNAIIDCGYDVVVPDGLVCCGMPAAASGDMGSARMAAEKNAEILKKSGCDLIVTACPTCGYAMKKLWSVFAEKSGHNDSFDYVSEKIADISDFIIRYGEKKYSAPGPDFGSDDRKTVTVHDPCHLKRSLGIYKEPRLILEMAGYKVREMKNSDRCCGMGGTFSISHYDLSMSVAEEKKKAVMDSGADVLAAACPACMMQIGGILAADGSVMDVRHPVEIYAEKIPNVF